MTTRTAGHRIHVAPPPDNGCRYAPRCIDCPWASCYYAMALAERRTFEAALAAIRPFVRRPDTAIQP